MALWTIVKVGKEDPRRVIHAFKVGLALALVSTLYLVEALFKGIDKNAMWAVMTVVVVMEFTVGATLCKGMNRGLGTVLAGSLAFLMEYIADSSTAQIFKAIFIGSAVFLVGTASTYVRFIPYVKRNCDYGVMIFLLTFNLITVSSYRVTEVLGIAKDRILTIAIGCAVCLVVSLVVFPNWSGEYLHDSTISNLQGLATSIQACVMQYFSESSADDEEDNGSSEDPIFIGYRAILDSKSSEETQAFQASWEPRWSRYGHRLPWYQYAKVGSALRHFSYTVVALHGCLQSEIQAPMSIRALYKDSCIKLADEVFKLLRELANSINDKRQLCPEILSNNLNLALQDLNNVLKSQPQLFLGPNKKVGRVTSLPSVNTDSVGEQLKQQPNKVLRKQLSKTLRTSIEFSEVLPIAAFISLLLEVVAKLDNVIDEVEQLGKLSRFREFRDGDEIVVDCETKYVFDNDLPSYVA